jgi:hypothetical protein
MAVQAAKYPNYINAFVVDAQPQIPLTIASCPGLVLVELGLY